MMYKIYYNNRLQHSYKIYKNEEIDEQITIQKLFMIYYKKTEIYQKLTPELLNIFINTKFELFINNNIINKENINNNIKSILNADNIINILLKEKTLKDDDGYNLRVNLLSYINIQNNDYNVLSKMSYNVNTINSISGLEINTLYKNILQQTQYKNLSYGPTYHNINIILYDMTFFSTSSGSIEEQIFNLVDLEEKEITEFEVINSTKIKKFTKPINKLFSPNPLYKNQYIAEIYTRELNKVLSKFKDKQINWYIINFKHIVDIDDIDCIIKQLNIKNLYIYPFCG